MIKISPSVLACDFSHLGEEVEKVENAGVEYLHLDVMDGAFVPNFSFGPCVIGSIRKQSKLVFDTHLMINDPINYIEAFQKVGSDIITFHYEATENRDECIDKIHSLGMKASMSFKPATDVMLLKPYLPKLEMVLVMSVEPGFGGQSFLPGQLEAVKTLVKLRKEMGLDFEIEIDGGVNTKNISDVIASGVDVVVAGSAIFKAADPAEAVKALKNAVNIH